MRTLSRAMAAAAFILPLIADGAEAVVTFDGVGTNDDDPVVVDGFQFDYVDQRHAGAAWRAAALTAFVEKQAAYYTEVATKIGLRK